MNNFCDNLKFLRHRDGRISQQSLAEYLGISRSLVGSWEEGRATPNTDMLLEISNFFYVSIDYLFFKIIAETNHDKVLINFHDVKDRLQEDSITHKNYFYKS